MRRQCAGGAANVGRAMMTVMDVHLAERGRRRDVPVCGSGLGG